MRQRFSRLLLHAAKIWPFFLDLDCAAPYVCNDSLWHELATGIPRKVILGTNHLNVGILGQIAHLGNTESSPDIAALRPQLLPSDVTAAQHMKLGPKSSLYSTNELCT